MNVLSLFDGISCGQVALNRAGIKYDKYFASEIDLYAKEITYRNFPDTMQLGDVTNISFENGNLYNKEMVDFFGKKRSITFVKRPVSEIDLLMGGSPCQGFSISGNQLNFDDSRSKLFFEYVRLLRQVQPKYFIFENVGSMKNEIKDAISKELGCEPISINSSLLSGQHRNRLYWCNFKVDLPIDRKISFEDILENDVDDKYYYSDKVLKRLDLINIKRTGKAGYKYNGVDCDKCPPITARFYKGMQSQYYPVVKDVKGFRNITPIECERLQTLPDNYTEGISNTQRYKSIGNGWTVDVISHILSKINL